MPISFLTIPLDLRTPGTYLEVDPSRALQGLLGLHHRLLVIGQRLATGETPACTPTMVVSPKDAVRRFGQGSMLANMLTASKTANGYTETWAVALDDDPAGVAASGTFTFGGSPTEAGTVSLLIGGVRVRVRVEAGETPTEVAVSAVAAINAQTSLSVTAAAALAVTTLTHRHKGEVGNNLDLRHSYYQGEVLPKGLTLTVGDMTGGTGNPEIGPALASLADRRCHYNVMPYTDASNLSEMEGWLNERWGPLKKLEGLGFTAARGTPAALSTLGSGRNSPFTSIMGAGRSPTAIEVWASVYGAVEAFNLNIDPARPTQTLVLTGVLPPAVPDILDTAERNVLLHDGISTHTVDDGGLVRIERDVTTYQTNALGEEDPSMLDINTMATLAYIKDQVRARVTNSFPRHKLAKDSANVGAGQAIVRPKDMRSELIALFREMEKNGIVENIDQFKTDLVVEINESDPTRLDALLPPDLVNQFRIFAGQIQYLL